MYIVCRFSPTITLSNIIFLNNTCKFSKCLYKKKDTYSFVKNLRK